MLAFHPSSPVQEGALLCASPFSLTGFHKSHQWKSLLSHYKILDHAREIIASCLSELQNSGFFVPCFHPSRISSPRVHRPQLFQHKILPQPIFIVQNAKWKLQRCLQIMKHLTNKKPHNRRIIYLAKPTAGCIEQQDIFYSNHSQRNQAQVSVSVKHPNRVAFCCILLSHAITNLNYREKT